MKRGGRALAALATCGLLACGGDRGGPSGPAVCARGVDAGVELVANEGAGRWERQGLEPELRQLWRAGGTREGEELAVPTFPAAGPDGHLAIPDFRLGAVMVVAPDGRWLGSWGRRGEGPGELARPVAATWSEGGRLAVFDVENARVVFLEDGEPAPEDVAVDPAFTGPIVASGRLEWAGVGPEGTVYALEPVSSLQGAPAGGAPESSGPTGDGDGPRRTKLLLRLPPAATTADTVARSAIPVLGEEPYAEREVPGWPRLTAAVGSDGSLVVGATDGRYAVDLHDPSGQRVRRICRDAPPLPLRADERGMDPAASPRDEDEGASDERASRRRSELLALLEEASRPDTPAPFGRLLLGVGGRLWVQRDRPSPVGRAESLYGRPGARWHVFGRSGEYLGEVRAPEGARLQAAAGDTVWALEFGRFDEAWVVAYRLELHPGEGR